MNEMKKLLQQALEDIVRLRHENAVLVGKVEMIDFFALVLQTTPSVTNVRVVEDITWKLEKTIRGMDE